MSCLLALKRSSKNLPANWMPAKHLTAWNKSKEYNFVSDLFTYFCIYFIN